MGAAESGVAPRQLAVQSAQADFASAAAVSTARERPLSARD
jgi:hypothetical protein